MAQAVTSITPSISPKTWRSSNRSTRSHWAALCSARKRIPPNPLLMVTNQILVPHPPAMPSCHSEPRLGAKNLARDLRSCVDLRTTCQTLRPGRAQGDTYYVERHAKGGIGPLAKGGIGPPHAVHRCPSVDSCKGGDRTPCKGGDRTPCKGGDRTPCKGGDRTPCKGGDRTPCKGGDRTPCKGGDRTPCKGGDRTPCKGGALRQIRV